MRILAWLTFAMLVWGASPLGAQDTRRSAGVESEPRRPEDPEAARAARDHFRRGLEHFRAHAYREAIREFELAATRIPSADLWFNIARAHEELSEYDLAIENYRRYLRDRVDPPDRVRVEAHLETLAERAEAARRARQEVPTTGTLRIQSSLDGADVIVDGTRRGVSPVEAPLALSPGPHRLDVEREGYIPFRAAPTISLGTTTGAYAELTPKTRYRSVRSKRRWTWLAMGLSAAALGTAIGFGVRAAALQGDGRFDDARTTAAVSDYALGAGIGLGVVSAILYFVEGRSVGSERVAP